VEKREGTKKGKKMSEETNALVIETSFGVKEQHEVEKDGKKVMVDNEKRTVVEFKLDFSKLSKEEIAVYAAREVTRDVNAEVREGRLAIADVSGKTIEVKPFEKGERGKAKVTEEVALKKLAELHGMSVEDLTKMLQKVKGGVK